jgi:hypothetical protein
MHIVIDEQAETLIVKEIDERIKVDDSISLQSEQAAFLIELCRLQRGTTEHINGG